MEVAVQALQALHTQSQTEAATGFHLISSQITSALQNQSNVLSGLASIASRLEYLEPPERSTAEAVIQEQNGVEAIEARQQESQDGHNHSHQPTNTGLVSNSSLHTPIGQVEQMRTISDGLPEVASRLGNQRYRSALATSTIGITIRGANRCSALGSCDCACHNSTRFHTPRFFRRFFGLLLVAYSGTPVVHSPCSRLNWQRLHSRSIMVTYHFPAWFLARIFHMIIMSNNLGDPTVFIVVRRRLNLELHITIQRLIFNGDIDAIKTLFSKRTVGPNDQDRFGATMLHVRIAFVSLNRYIIDPQATTSFQLT